MQKTLHAIDRVGEIRQAREKDFYTERMAAPRRQTDEASLRELEREGDRLLGADERREKVEEGVDNARRERRVKRAAKMAKMAEHAESQMEE